MKRILDYFKLRRASADKSRSKYTPHQGKQEVERRKKRIAKYKVDPR